MIVLYLIIAYMIGSIPFSYIVPKLMKGIDIRKVGSGNAGVTNVVRSAGLPAGILALLGDFSKGLVPTIIASKYLNTNIAPYIGAMAVFGHCYSPFLNFKGGKGIATSAGMLTILSPLSILILLPVQFGVLFLSGYMGLASIISAALLPVTIIFLQKNMSTILVSIILSLFVIYKHKANIERMVAGKEDKFKIKKK